MLLYSLTSGAVRNGACALPVHRPGGSLSPAQMCLSRCAQWCANPGGAHVRRDRLQLLFSMMGNVALGAASAAEQVLGLSHVAHSSGSSTNILYITTKIWGPNFYLLPFLFVANVGIGAF